MTNLNGEVARYSAGAAVAFVADLATLSVFVEALNVHYLAAATVGFMTGTLVLYWISVRHVFRYRRLKDEREELAVFAAIGALGVLVNLGCMYVAVEVINLHYLAGKIGSAAVTFVTNFGLRRMMLFTPQERKIPANRSTTRAE